MYMDCTCTCTVAFDVCFICSYCLNTSLRLFIIGHYHKGKTTLLAGLRGKKQSSTFDERAKRPLDLGDLQQLSPEGTHHCFISTSTCIQLELLVPNFIPLCVYVSSSTTQTDRESTVGIQCDRWMCKRSNTPKHGPVITFYTWDFAGQVMYNTGDICMCVLAHVLLCLRGECYSLLTDVILSHKQTYICLRG